MTQTLTYLNNASTSTVTFTDNRASGVVFDRVEGKSYSFTETSLSFPVYIGANILEIINPSVALVRYKITLGTTQASLSWPSIPFGITLVQSGTQYTLYGLTSVADWELLKAPTITIDPAFNGSFSYTADIVYNTDTTADNEFGWSVGTYIPTTLMETSASLTCDNDFIGGATSNINANFQMGIVGVKVLGVEADMVTDAVYTANGATALSSAATISAKPRALKFTDTRIQVLESPAVASANFGQQVRRNASGQIIAARSSTTSALDDPVEAMMRVMNSAGSIFQSIDENSDKFTNGAKINTSGAILIATEDERQLSGTPDFETDILSLFKFVSGAYVEQDTIDVGHIYLDLQGYSHISPDGNYVVVCQNGTSTHSGAGGEPDGKVYIYDISSDSLTLDSTIVGDSATYNTTGVTIGEQCACNNTYVVTAGTDNKLYVYDLATQTHQRTITTNGCRDAMTLDGDNVIVAGNNYISSFDITDGSQNYAWSGSPDPTAFDCDTIRVLDSNFIGFKYGTDTSIKILNINSGTIASTITSTDIVGSSSTAYIGDFVFYDANTLVVGLPSYQDTETFQGAVYINGES